MKRFVQKLNIYFTFFLLLFVVNLYGQPKQEKLSGIDLIKNKGQIANAEGVVQEEILFTTSVDKADLYFLKNKIIFITKEKYFVETEESIRERSHGNIEYAEQLELHMKHYRFELEFNNTNKDVIIDGLDECKNYSNYYLAHCKDGIMKVPHFKSIYYKDIYPNIDLKFYSNTKGLKFDFIVNPGGNPNNISYTYKDTKGLEKDLSGNININTPYLNFTEAAPYSYFLEDNNDVEVESSFIISDNNTIRFKLDNYPNDKTLIIDPTLDMVWSTYFDIGASSTWDNVSFNSSGDFYAACYHYSSVVDVLDAGGFYQSADGGDVDLAIIKFSNAGVQLWTTYYGGTGNEYLICNTTAVDGNDNLYVGGETASQATFPLQNAGGYYDGATTSTCGFLLKFDNNCNRLWATFIGASGARVRGITTASNNDVYIVGACYSSAALPVQDQGGGAYYQSAHGGGDNGYIMRFNSSTTKLWCTYFGGDCFVNFMDIHIDPSNNYLYCVGELGGWSVPNSYPPLIDPGGGAYFDNSVNGKQDLFIARFNSSRTLTWSTIYGGQYNDNFNGDCGSVDTDSDGNFYFCGKTMSDNLPLHDGGGYYQSSIGGNGVGDSKNDGYILKFNSSAVRQWATFYGGSESEEIRKLKIDNNDNVWIGGYTTSSTTNNFPLLTATDHYNQAWGGSSDAFIGRFTQAGVREWVSCLGGSGGEMCRPFAIYEPDATTVELFMVDYTASTDFPTLDPGGVYYIGARPTNPSAYITKFSYATCVSSTAPTSISATVNPVCSGNSTTLTVNGGSLGTGASWKWYTASCGGTYIGTGSSIAVSPTSTTTYYVRADGTCGTTACASKTISTYNSGSANGIWVGGINTGWYECRNWGQGKIPDNTINVTIPSGCTYYPNITSGTANCNELDLLSGGSLTVNGGILNVTGTYFYKRSGGNATYTSGTCNVYYHYYNYGTSGESRVNGGTLNIGTASISYEFRNYNGKLYVTSGTMDCGRYLYNFNGFASNYVNISGGSVYADYIPNYEGAIWHSGGTLTSGGYYRENDAGGGNYYGSGSAVMNFTGSSYIRLMKPGTYFNDVNINGIYYIETGSTQNFDINGYFTIASTKSFDCNGRTMYVAGNWTNSGTFIHDNNTVYFDGGSANITTGGTAAGKKFYNMVISGATKTLVGYLDADNNITVSGTLSRGSNIIYVGGNWDSSTGSVTNVSISSSYPIYFDGATSPVTIKGNNSTKHFGYIRPNKTNSTNIINMANSFKCYRCEPWKGTFNMSGYTLTCDNYFLANYDNNDPAGYDVYVNVGSGRINAPSGFQARRGAKITMTSGIIDCGYFILYDGIIDAYMDMDGGNIYISSYFRTYSGTYFRGDGGTVTFDGTPATNRYLWAHTTAADCYFNNLTIATNRYVDLYLTDFSNLDVNGNLLINSGATLYSNSHNIYCAGNWTNSGTFDPGTNTVTFDGTGAQSINAGGTGIGYAFYDVNITNAGTTSMISNMEVGRNFNVQGGTFAINNYDLYTINGFSGSASISNGAEVDMTGSGSYWRAAAANNGTLTINGTLDLNDGKVTTGSGITLSVTGIINQTGGTFGVGDNFTINGDYNGDGGTLRGRSDGDDWAPQIIINAAGTYCYNFFTDGGTTTNPSVLSGTQPLTVLNDVSIPAGDQLNAGSTSIYLAGNWTNSGVFSANTSTVTFNGSANQTINGSSSTTFYNLTINNSGTGIIIGQNIDVTNNLTMTDGDIDLQNSGINLSTTGSLTGETASNRIKVSDPVTHTGTITATRDVSNVTNYNLAGLSIELTTTANLGTTTIIRGHQQQQGSGSFSGNYSIFRYYDVSPTTSEETTIRFNYFEDELNAHAESELLMYHDIGYWQPMSTTTDAANNRVTATTNSFSKFTLGSESLPLPIELLLFDAFNNGKDVTLKWSTASETNNDYFNVERSVNGVDFENIKKIDGAGNINTIINYITYDKHPLTGFSYYRLKQTDFDGLCSYSNIRSVYFYEDNNIIFSVYPNPSKDYINCMLNTNTQSPTLIKIETILGQILYEELIQFNENKNTHQINIEHINPGSYFLTATSDTHNFKKIIKLIIVD